jgi:hypothetical protein
VPYLDGEVSSIDRRFENCLVFPRPTYRFVPTGTDKLSLDDGWADDFIPSEISDNITYIITSPTRITLKEKVILPAFNQGIMKTTSALLRILLLTSIQMSLSSLVPS